MSRLAMVSQKRKAAQPSTSPSWKTMISLGFVQGHMTCGSFEAPLLTNKNSEASCFAGCALLSRGQQAPSKRSNAGMPCCPLPKDELLLGEVANPSPSSPRKKAKQIHRWATTTTSVQERTVIISGATFYGSRLELLYLRLPYLKYTGYIHIAVLKTST